MPTLSWRKGFSSIFRDSDNEISLDSLQIVDWCILSIYIKLPVADPGFSPGGCANSQNCYYFSNFCWKLHENERIWTPRGGARPWRPPLGSANAYFPCIQPNNGTDGMEREKNESAEDPLFNNVMTYIESSVFRSISRHLFSIWFVCAIHTRGNSKNRYGWNFWPKKKKKNSYLHIPTPINATEIQNHWRRVLTQYLSYIWVKASSLNIVSELSKFIS